MAANKVVRFGPTAIPASATNLVNPPTVSGGVGVAGTNTGTYLIVKHIRIVNKDASARTVTLYIGATGGSAAGTEFAFTAYSIPANSFVDWYGVLRLEPADFLTGIASQVTTLVFTGEGEIGING
jgi:hypothetical protein